MTDPAMFWCSVCGKNDDAPHTPIDHPWLLRGHRLVRPAEVERRIAEARQPLLDRIERLEAALAKVDRMKVGHHHPPDVLCIPECPRWWKDAFRAALETSDD